MRSLTMENRHREWKIYEGWAMENGLRLQLMMPKPYHRRPREFEKLKNGHGGSR